jgi:hypothetical protein
MPTVDDVDGDLLSRKCCRAMNDDFGNGSHIDKFLFVS